MQIFYISPPVLSKISANIQKILIYLFRYLFHIGRRPVFDLNINFTSYYVNSFKPGVPFVGLSFYSQKPKYLFDCISCLVLRRKIRPLSIMTFWSFGREFILKNQKMVDLYSFRDINYCLFVAFKSQSTAMVMSRSLPFMGLLPNIGDVMAFEMCHKHIFNWAAMYTELMP